MFRLAPGLQPRYKPEHSFPAPPRLQHRVGRLGGQEETMSRVAPFSLVGAKGSRVQIKDLWSRKAGCMVAFCLVLQTGKNLRSGSIEQVQTIWIPPLPPGHSKPAHEGWETH